MNTATMTGNLTRDPETRFLADGTATTNFSIAVNRRYMSHGEWTEQTSFFDVVAWRDLGEHVALSLAKGDRVTVTGYMEQRTWTTAEGDKRSRIELVAEDIGVSLKFQALANANSEQISADF